MPGENNTPTPTTPTLAEELGDTIKSIGNDLFPSKTESGSGDLPGGDGTPSTPSPVAATTPSPTTPTPIPPIDPAAVLGDVMPKSWKKDLEPVWAGASPELRAQITKREAEVSRGMGMYAQSHDSWGKLTQPYEQVLKANPNVDPVALYSGLMNTHLMFMYGSPAEKTALAQKILADYKVDLAGTAPAPAPAVPPEFLQRFNALEQTFQKQTLSQQEAIVSAFFSDPKNTYAEEVAPDIIRLLQTGAATDLPSAYEKALWLNPAVRAKLVQKQIDERDAAARAEVEKKRKLGRLNVNGSDAPGTPASKKGSINDTVDAVVAKYRNVQ